MHLSRVSIADYRGDVILDSFVRPTFVPFARVERWFINIYSSSQAPHRGLPDHGNWYTIFTPC